MYDAAMDYVITKADGAVTEASYEYLGADGFCKSDPSADAVAFKVDQACYVHQVVAIEHL